MEDARSSQDALTTRLLSVSHTVLTVIFGLLPIIFLPFPAAGLEFTKILFVAAGLAIALIFYSLSVLRSGRITLIKSYALGALWLVVLCVGVSALLSGDLRDAFIGNTIGINTTAFVALLALTATTWSLIGITKESVMRLYMFFVISTFILVVFHLLRIVFGADFLSFGVFMSSVSTPIGGWNDLALFLGLTVLLSIVTLEQLPLTKSGRLLFAFVVAAALIMLAVINFLFVWVVLGVVSLVMVVYTLSKDRFSAKKTFAGIGRDAGITSLTVPVVVFIVSMLFALGGSFFGGMISKATEISYIEVRPSVSATADIARGVYAEEAFFGNGANKFADAWRLHKDQALNATIFWNTEFQSGSGYIPTFFVTSGIAGALAWILFLGLFLAGGIRMLMYSESRDRTWYFIGTSSFVGATFIWGMSLVYVPGTAVLLLGALCTGLTFVSAAALREKNARTVTLAASRQSSFILTLAVIVVIISSVGALYGVGRHYAAVYLFADGLMEAQAGGDVDAVATQLASAFEMSPNDLIARRIAEVQLSKMNVLLASEAPAEAEQQQFQSAVANGVNAARLATELDSSDPENWAVLGRLYATLIPLDVDQAFEMSRDALTRARDLDPLNPLRRLELALAETSAGNTDTAYALVQEAIDLKPNYTDALFYLSQLEIARGDVESAIRSARSIISIEPQNPTRYYQLGILEASRQQYQAATTALETAIALNPDFANARYYLALVYSEMNRPNDARVQLERVLELNPGNELVIGLLAQLESDGRITIGEPQTGAGPLTEGAGVGQTLDDVTADEAPDTNLVRPVNTPTEKADSEAAATNQGQ